MHLWKLKCFKHTQVVGAVTPTQARACPCCALAPVRKCAYFLFFLSCHTVVACLCAHSLPARMMMSSHPLGSSSMKNIIHFQVCMSTTCNGLTVQEPSTTKNSSSSGAPKTGAQLRDNREERDKCGKTAKKPFNAAIPKLNASRLCAHRNVHQLRR